MCEPMDEWQSRMGLSPDRTIGKITSPEASLKVGNDFSFASEPLGAEDNDELTKSTTRASLDQKVLL